MRILGLGGRLPETLHPMEALLAALARPGDEVEAQRYAFWTDDHVNPHLTDEARRAAAWGADRLVAKSIGCLVAIAACTREGRTPRACVFIGAPVNRLTAEGRARLLGAHAAVVPTLFIQQAQDPTGGLADLAALVPAGDVREASGTDHVYGDAHELAGLIEAWPAWRP